MNKNTIIGVLGGAATVLLVIYIVGFFTPVSVSPVPSSVPDVNVGAMPGDSIPGNYFTVGGAKYYSIQRNIKSASSTACSMPAPPNATSTLINASVNFTTSSATAVTVGFSKATSFSASTTLIGSGFTSGTNGQVTFGVVATSTVPGSVTIFRPGTSGPDAYLNVYFWSATEGSTYTKSAPKGTCNGLWKIEQ